MTLAPLANSARLVEQVAESLRTAIVSGTLPPGHRLSVPEVARLLGVSRTPAREAMLILERDGLIATRPRLGAEVVRYGDADLQEMLDLREALDGMAARRAAERMSPAEKQALQALLEQHDAALSAADMERHVELDVEFHRHIRDAAGNQRLSRALLDVERQSHLLMHSTSRAPGFSGPATLRDHRAIVAAIVDGDGDAAERAARAHIHRIRAFCAALADRDQPAPRRRTARR
jgi:DNA-binding GntR family transcriptional regulator